MPEIFKIPGVERVPPEPNPRLRRLLSISTRKFVEVRPTVRGAEVFATLDNVGSTDLIELEFEGGIRQWIRADQLREDLQRAGISRGAADGAIEIPSSLPGPGSTRGEKGGFLPLLFVKVHDVDLGAMVNDIAKDLRDKGMEELGKKLLEKFAEPGAVIATRYILNWLESNLDPHPGLYRLDDPAHFGAEITRESPYTGDPAEPILLFIHGTGSTTRGSFGELTGTPAWKTLKDKYKDRILALEHRTMSQSPIENAIYAATLLPKNAKLHLVTHSRGGLVGELLCLKPLTTSDLDRFRKERDNDVPLLEELSKLLQDQDFTVERFVRVACPARGTLLASDRLDRYLSVVLSLIGKIPVLAANPAYAIFEACVVAIVKMRANPSEVPGVEAMRPESPVIHLLNRPDLKTNADLAIIAGKSEMGGLWRTLGLFAASVFYRQAHDFVVNTDAMYGGMSRGDAYFFLSQGGTVDHFHYFANEETRDQMLAWLIAGANKRGGAFAKLQYLNSGLIFPSLRGAANRPLLIFVPGLFGTHLRTAENKRVWLNGEQLSPGTMGSLGAPSVTVDLSDPSKPAEAVFPYRQAPLLEYLGNSYQLAAFPYDWRRVPEDAADDLAKLVKAALQEHPERVVRLLAAGSGGNVVRAMATRFPDLWKSLIDRSGRVVVLGSPRTVTSTAIALSAGKHKLTRLLDLVDRGASGDLGHLFGSLPSIQAFMSGDGTPAPEGFLFIAAASPNSEREKFSDSRVWYAPAHLGNLGEHWPSFEAMRELLASGMTGRLSSRPIPNLDPTYGDGPIPVLYPTLVGIADAAFEAEDIPVQEPITVTLSVTHGHLRGARYPVLAGHYLGDGIVSAEEALDRELNGSLSQRFHMDLYPGAAGSVEVVQVPQCAPPGALIIGLGEVGHVKPEVVQRGVGTATLKYALMELERHTGSRQMLSLGISSLLVGTYGGNSLSMRDSIKAVTEGVVQANQTLRSQNLWDRVRIAQIEFIDLFLDQAIAATHEVCNFVELRRDDPSDEVRFVTSPRLNIAEGGQFRRPANPYVVGWWRRVSISRTGDALSYTTLTDRARADLQVQTTQQKLIEYYLRNYSNSTEFLQDLSVVLFETLIPKELKDQIRDGTSLILVLDKHTVGYPWELLAFRSKDEVQPLATNIGLLRQLVTEGGLPQARTTRIMSALVVGDPDTKDPKFPPLARAYKEAQLVARIFEDAGYNTKALLREDARPLAIHAGIVARENRLIHIASHGYFDANEPENSGVVIGPGLYLTAKELARIEPLPEFVFLNCCELGKMSGDESGEAARERPKLAGTLAQQLIAQGIKAVIAAGWAINDAAALTFAETFYTELMQNKKRFGEAVREARRRTYERHPGSNTFAAYQCYGNPDFALSVSEKGDAGPPRRMVAREEFLDYARNIEARARGAEPDTIATLTADLRQIAESLPKYAKDGEVLSAIGSAYAALGAFTLAIEAYERSLNDPNSRVLVRAVEQLANLQYRYAALVPGPGREKLTMDADKHLQWVRDLGESTERLSLLGSAFKRAARWSEGEARMKNLGIARDFYKRAYEPDSVDYYPALNEVGLALLLPDFDKQGALDLVSKAESYAREQAAESDTLWNRVAIPDAMLLRFLIQNELKETAVQDNLILEYAHALRGATQQEKLSVGGQIHLLRDLLDPSAHADSIRALSRLINELNF